jgi:hypothetical protein
MNGLFGPDGVAADAGEGYAGSICTIGSGGSGDSDTDAASASSS